MLMAGTPSATEASTAATERRSPAGVTIGRSSPRSGVHLGALHSRGRIPKDSAHGGRTGTVTSATGTVPSLEAEGTVVDRTVQ